jgi:hypothetical protein
MVPLYVPGATDERAVTVAVVANALAEDDPTAIVGGANVMLIPLWPGTDPDRSIIPANRLVGVALTRQDAPTASPALMVKAVGAATSVNGAVPTLT